MKMVFRYRRQPTQEEWAKIDEVTTALFKKCYSCKAYNGKGKVPGILARTSSKKLEVGAESQGDFITRRTTPGIQKTTKYLCSLGKEDCSIAHIYSKMTEGETIGGNGSVECLL